MEFGSVLVTNNDDINFVTHTKKVDGGSKQNLNPKTN